MTQQTQTIPYNFEALFKEFSLFTRDLGAKALLGHIKALNNTALLNSDSLDHNLVEQFNNSIKKYGVDFMCLFFRTNRTKILNFEIVKNKELENKVFEIVCNVYKTNIDNVINKRERDGVRIYASGTLFKLLLDTCNYTVDEVMEITNKPRSIISRHKNVITNLDYKHPMDKKILEKYIDSKKQLIKYILDEYQEKN